MLTIFIHSLFEYLFNQHKNSLNIFRTITAVNEYLRNERLLLNISKIKKSLLSRSTQSLLNILITNITIVEYANNLQLLLNILITNSYC